MVSEHGFLHASRTHDLIGFYTFYQVKKSLKRHLGNRSRPAIGFVVLGIRIEIVESRTVRLLVSIARLSG